MKLQMRNIFFIAFAFAFCSGILGIQALAGAHIIEVPTKSYLEGRSYADAPELSVDRVFDKTFQDDMESYLSDGAPQRSKVLLATAFVQSKVIALATKPFGFNERHTYYGSDHAYSNRFDAVCKLPDKLSDISREEVDRATATVNALIKQHPDVNWAFYLTDYISRSKASPVHDLIANSEDYDFWYENFLSKLDNCTIYNGGYDDPEKYYEDYFHTDHHWKVKTAFAAYEQIVEGFGKKPIDSGELLSTYSYGLWGSLARSGRSIWGAPDTIEDYLPPMDGISIRRNGKEQQISEICEGYSGKQYHKAATLSDVYAGYFHGDTACIELTNDAIPDGSLLIIGDSYTNNMERFFAGNYHYVCVIDPRRYKKDYDKLIEEHQFDDAVFIGCVSLMRNEDAMKNLA